MIPVGKKIVSVVTDDVRFLEDENVLEAMHRDIEFGGAFKIFFEDNTYVTITAVVDRWNNPMMASHAGRWRVNDRNEIEIIQT